jgi:hypothetical protein
MFRKLRIEKFPFGSTNVTGSYNGVEFAAVIDGTTTEINYDDGRDFQEIPDTSFSGVLRAVEKHLQSGGEYFTDEFAEELLQAIEKEGE